MKRSGILAPLPLLADPNLTASAKLLWLLTRAANSRAPGAPVGSDPNLLAVRAGLSRRTVLRARDQLLAAGWLTASHEPTNLLPGAPRAAFPPELLEDGRISAQARVLYGFLQAATKGRATTVLVTYRRLSELARLTPLTVQRTLRQLVEAGWLTTTQKNQQVPLQITLCETQSDRQELAAQQARRRIDFAKHKGEAIMREYLNVLIDSDHYDDDAAPGFLVNPWTDGRLELDRFYPPDVAFEFQGPQHEGPTERFSAEESHAQRGRDMIKLGLCVTQGITLILVYPEDLSLAGMQRKVGSVLPLRDLANQGRVIAYLERRSRSYRAKAITQIHP